MPQVYHAPKAQPKAFSSRSRKKPQITQKKSADWYRFTQTEKTQKAQKPTEDTDFCLRKIHTENTGNTEKNFLSFCVFCTNL